MGLSRLPRRNGQYLYALPCAAQGFSFTPSHQGGVTEVSKNRDLKVEKVAEIVERLKGAESVTVVSYSGLTVEQDTNLRRQCRESDVDYCVLRII